MLSVEQATGRILDGVRAIEDIESVAIADALGRVLAAPLKATFDQPPFAASAMDGYAVRLTDLAGETPRLDVIGEAAAGHAFRGTVGPGEAVRIFTGAPLPDGADAIVIQENVTREGKTAVVIGGEPDPGHIRPQGCDFAAGAELVPADRRLTARDVTLAAAMNRGTLEVRRKPVVAILATGDELVAPGTPLGSAQIVSSNPYGIAGIVASAGAEPRLLGIAGDTRESLEAHFDAAEGVDLLITIGGASVGDHDLVAPVLQARGMTLDFWKIAMRPGKPVMFGRIGANRMIGVPGNPVSSLICARLFAVPLIRRLLGLRGPDLPMRQMPLAAPLGANGPRAHYMRATLVGDDGSGFSVRPCRSQDSSLLTVLADADVLIVRPPLASAAAAGDLVTVVDLDF